MFDRMVDQMDGIVGKTVGNSIRYYRDGGVIPVTGVKEENVEIAGEAGTIISHAVLFHLFVSDVGQVARGHQIRDAKGLYWYVQQEVESDGHMVTVQVVPYDVGS